MYLQNKQENSGDASAASPMPKSDQGILREKEFVFFSQESLTFFGAIPSSFMKEGGGMLFMRNRWFPFETEGEGGA